MMSDSKVSRRTILAVSGWGPLALTTVGSLGALIRFLVPNMVYEPDRRFKVGRPEEIPLNGYLERLEERVVIFRDVAGFHAIGTTCTHLGCITKKTDSGFDCPCHGSRFDEVGIPYAGPAPRPLPWCQISVAPDGQLVVDLDREVEIETKFRV